VPRLGGVRFSSDQSIMHGFLEPWYEIKECKYGI
jgi:hypothetical protein